ncbi:piggyBac transposable element-derived protein 4-like [Amphiprion ocellaris]|uniref:piggyBac transposable element-derived protein 4-like n=1 Tax=Amphiprion ocellaris TaxID=80972 RepID=UPI002410CF93|nr:piggyBac transposable element-derived protein 4-like [Amphiprion ocellaris]
MPSKPAKYGLKIFWMCDGRVPYAIDGIVYTGRQPGEEAHRNLGADVVHQLCSTITGTGRNITVDNFFTSVPLAASLLEENLTIVGTLRQNKPDIPPIMKPSRSREACSSEFGFNGGMTMVSYVPKKGKAVILLSTMHHDKAVADTPKKKPEIIIYYNRTKGGVDLLDQMVSNYTCKRRTRRWPLVLWYNMLDVATLNAYTNYTLEHPDYHAGLSHTRRLFIKELCKELVMPHMTRRLAETLNLPKILFKQWEDVGYKKNMQPPLNHKMTSAKHAKRRGRERGALSAHVPKTEKLQSTVPSAAGLWARSTEM